MARSVLDKQEPVEDMQAPLYEKPAKPRGCLFWGCITVVILVVLAGAGIGIATHKMVKYAKGFTSNSPVEIPVYEPSEGEYESVQKRIEEFKNAVESGMSDVELVLTGNDINAIIASDEDWAKLREKAYVKIEGDKITVDVSMPLEGIPWFSGCYLNGSAVIKASMESGLLFVTLDQIEVNGEPLPEKFMSQLRGKNLAKDMYEDKEKMELISKVKDVRVEDGKLVLISN